MKRVPPGSVLELDLLNIFLNYKFFLLKETHICSCAVDTTSYACDQILDQIINRLEQDSLLSISWLEKNYIKLHTDKCHLFISGK